MHDTQGEVTQKPGFQKGHAKVGGRKKGGQNKITRDVKEALLEAGEQYGSDGNGTEGIVGCFQMIIKKKPEAWLLLLLSLYQTSTRSSRAILISLIRRLKRLKRKCAS